MFSQFRKELVRKQNKLISALQQVETQGDELDYTNIEAIETKLENDDEPEVYEFMLEDSIKFIDGEQTQDDDEQEVEGEEIEALDECDMQMDFTDLKVVNIKKKDTIYHCEYCTFFAGAKAQLDSHMNRCTGMPVIVTEYDASSSQDQEAKPTSFACDLCTLEFKKRHLLNRHVREKHTVKIRQFACKHCDKAFFNSTNLKKHESSHNQKNLPCDFCGKLFTCVNNLRTHLYYHNEPKFVCTYEGCEKKFFMKKLLKAHLNVRLNMH